MMSDTGTFKDEILEVAEGEEIIGIKILDQEESYFGDTPEKYTKTREFVGKLMSWKDLAPYLDYDYDREYGGMDSHNIIAWTASRVLYIHEYDGSSWVTYVDRNPN